MTGVPARRSIVRAPDAQASRLQYGNPVEGVLIRMRNLLQFLLIAVCLAGPLFGQSRRIWVLKEPDSIVEYDPATFVAKQTQKVPEDVLKAARILQINAKGQMLFAPNTDDPSPDVGKNGERFWFWDGQATTMLGREIIRVSASSGSNQKVTESSPWPFLSADGLHLYWFTNEFNKLTRDNVDLSASTTFHSWQSALSGRDKQDAVSIDFPECRCTTGACSETCPEVRFWIPDAGLDDYFMLTRLIQGTTETKYISSSLYLHSGGTWVPTELKQPLQRVLDSAEHGAVILSAILDIGCCGWENQSDDQTVLLSYGKSVVVFDEREQFKNPDYDVSFFTENAKLSPDQSMVAMTVEASSKSSQPIQLSEQGQGDAAESLRIRKALTELPGVQVVTATEPVKRTAFLPHAVLVGWLNEKEILIIENKMLVAYNVAAGTRRKSTVRVDDPGYAFVR
jgi:hypothetical protein